MQFKMTRRKRNISRTCHGAYTIKNCNNELLTATATKQQQSKSFRI